MNRYREPRSVDKLREELLKQDKREVEASVGRRLSAATWEETFWTLYRFEEAHCLTQRVAHAKRLKAELASVQVHARRLSQALRDLEPRVASNFVGCSPSHAESGSNPVEVWGASQWPAALTGVLNCVAHIAGEMQTALADRNKLQHKDSRSAGADPVWIPQPKRRRSDAYIDLVTGLGFALRMTPGIRNSVTLDPVSQTMKGPLAEFVRAIWQWLPSGMRPPSPEALARYIEKLPKSARGVRTTAIQRTGG